MAENLTPLFEGSEARIDPVLLYRVVEQNPASILITDAQCRTVYVNRKFTEITGYSKDEVLGQIPRLLKNDAEHTEYHTMWQLLHEGRDWRGNFPNRKKNGELFWERVVISPIYDDQGRNRYLLAIKEDISEQKKIEEKLEKTAAEATQLAANMEFLNAELKAAQSQMLQNEKMASIGVLAAGVAHEINNPVGFVSSNLHSLKKYLDRFTGYLEILEETLQQRAPETWQAQIGPRREQQKIAFLLEDCSDLIDESVEGAERIQAIVRNLKTFARVDQAERQVADLNECLECTISMVWNEIKYKATLERDLGDLPQVRCQPRELTQMLTNILLNAVQAIERDGLIKVRSWADRETVYIRIEDNGCGIPAEHLDRIFEPFFTTKEVGKGTGLGMSICYDIIKKHQGRIDVASEPGRGTTFTIALPIRAQDEEQEHGQEASEC